MRSTWARIATAIPKTRKKIPSSSEDDRRQNEEGEQGETSESEDMQRMSIEEAEASAEDAQEATAEAADAPSSDMADDADMGDSETPSEPWRPRAGHNEYRGPEYGAFVTKFDEEIEAEDLCEPEELDRLRSYLDKQLSHLQGVVARLANRLQRRLMAQQNRAWEFDLEEGMLDPARLSRIIVDPHASAVVQAREGHQFPRHGGDAAARQFRFDARPSDHGRRHLRRHSRAHAGALRREGRDSRLHHARLEGRASRARPGLPPASRPIPAGSTICAISSTRRRTRPGGARARISV